MTENKYKHAASSADSTEIASSHNNNAQSQSTNAGGSNTKPKEKKNDSEATVALANTQLEREKDKEPHDSPKIVGGSDAEKSEMPFMVSLMRRGGHFCGASILNERWLVTAGHCVCNGLNKIFQASQIQGVIGLHSISQYLNGNSAEKSTPTRINFKSIIPHPKYECTNVKHDIALLQLDEPLQFTDGVKPICVSVENPLIAYENQLAIVSGWGWTNENQEEGHKADILKKVAVKIWNNNSCEKSYKRNGKPSSIISDTQLCAGFKNGGADSCWADSGGPLIMKDKILVGIVSTGIGCARPGLPGIYTRVGKYVDWIDSVLKNANAL